MKIAELFESEEKITPSKVKAAIARADRAELAIEREQSKSGYGRSNDRVRELRSKYSSLRAEANRLEALLKKQQKVDEAVLKDPKSKQSDIKNLLDKMSDNAAKNLNIHAGVDDFRALVVGGGSRGMHKLQQALVDAGYDDAGGSYEDNKLIWQKLGVSKADFEHLVELSL